MSMDGRRGRRPDRHVQLSREMGMDMDEWLDDDPFTDADLGIPPSADRHDDRMPEYPEPPARRKPRRAPRGTQPRDDHADNAPSANMRTREHHVHNGSHDDPVRRSPHAGSADKREHVNNGRSAGNGDRVYNAGSERRRIRRPDDDGFTNGRAGASRSGGRRAARGVGDSRMGGDRVRTGRGGNPRVSNRGDDRRADDGQRMYTLASGRRVPVDSIIDDPWELVDSNGVFRDGPDVPHVRYYPTGIDDLVVERIEMVNHKKRVRHLHVMTYEEFSPLMGTTEAAKQRVRSEIYEQPYDSAGYLRVFLLSKGMARAFELGSKASAKDFANEMNDNLDRFMSERVDVSYRDGSSADHKEPEWAKKR